MKILTLHSRLGLLGALTCLLGSAAYFADAQNVTVAKPASGANAIGAGPTTSPQDAEFFEKRVRPLLFDQCFTCHSDRVQQGNLRLDSREALLKGGGRGSAIVVGQPEQSLLIQAVSHRRKDLQMPPTGSLSAEQIGVLAEWIRRGAPWSAGNGGSSLVGHSAFNLAQRAATHWSWKPIRRPAVPQVKNRAWVRNPIDAFLLAKMEAKGLKPAPPADRRTLLRRVTFDLTGLPPTPVEIDAFLADRSSNAYAKVVDRLLASPAYGERWARHWLDLVRYAETDGHEFDFEKPGAFEYRDYVIRAFNADVPYNQFVTEQITGDLLPAPRRHPTEGFNESIIGTGFWWLGEGKHSPVDLRDDQAERVDNQIDVMSKTFLGLSLGCARCHDHKFDAISTKDYYALFGYLQSSRYQQAAINPPQRTARAVSQLAQDRKAQLPLLIQQAAHSHVGLLDRLPAALTGALAPSKLRLASEPVSEPRASQRPSGTTPAPQMTWETYLRDVAAKSHLDLFYPWTVLTGSASQSEAGFAHAREQLLQEYHVQQERAAQAQRSAIVFEDFKQKSFANWSVTGEAFGNGPVPQSFVLDERGAVPQITGLMSGSVADSGNLSTALEGALRSRTFTIPRKRIWIRMAGHEGQARLVIDGFQRIRDPIYGGLEINVSADRMTWFVIDVNKWVGHPAYLEFLDPGKGRIAIEKIVFSDEDPVEAPNPLVVRMLEDPALTSVQALAQRYGALFSQPWERWAQGTLSADDSAWLEIVDWILRNPTLTDSHAVPADAALREVSERLRATEAILPPQRHVMAMIDGTGWNEPVHIRGNYRTPGQVIPRRFLEALCGATQPEPQQGSGRLELAQKMVALGNPLLARVIVNRLWQHHFGAGLVRTPDDFGFMGERPTHPELLDWLAFHFVAKPSVERQALSVKNRTHRAKGDRDPSTLSSSFACGWSLKKMHRMMVLSNAYCEAGKGDPKADTADPQNRLVHKRSVQRLEAEAIRDSILAVSGRLDHKMYGPSVMPYLTPYMEGRGRPDHSGPLDGDGRRSLYISVRRNFLTPMFLAFDYPVPFNTLGRRTVSNVPAQALTLMNNPFVIQQAGVWARHLLAAPNRTDRDRVRTMYLTAYGRPPTDEETKLALAFLNAQSPEAPGQRDAEADRVQAWADLCHVLMNVKEFIFIN
jgi:hypothetical protein